jgi:hypothetical protein
MSDAPDNQSSLPMIMVPGQRPRGGPNRRSRPPAGRRPLPDAHAISACLVPEVAPPYDDAVQTRSQAQSRDRWPGGETPVPGEGPARDQATLAADAWPSQFAQVLSETLAGSRPASQLTPWTTEQARKRISQLGPMLAPRGVPQGRPPGLATARRPRVRRVIVSSPAQGVLEMTVIVDVGSRARAVAVRLERSATGDAPAGASQHHRPLPDGRTRPPGWLCTAVEAA